jgi:phosphoribosylformylglycinamidine synthase subunit PurS
VYNARVEITLRPSILDPQGKAVEHAIATLGVGGVTGVRIGKNITMMIDAPDEQEARRRAEEICKKLLANPVMEDFALTVSKG